MNLGKSFVSGALWHHVYLSCTVTVTGAGEELDPNHKQTRTTVSEHHSELQLIQYGWFQCFPPAPAV
ncbi:hypothetical protein AOLI_G00191870 [Acnodon oligacanthus]